MAVNADPQIGKRSTTRLSPMWRGLSGRLLLMTLLMVMLAEIFIFVPSIARYRLTWLSERLEAAQIAVLALEARPDNMVDKELANELLRNAEVLSVVLRKDESKSLFLTDDMPQTVDKWVDLRSFMWWDAIVQAYGSLRFGEGRILAVKGDARFRPDTEVEIVVDETALCKDMLAYSRNILLLSLFISTATALGVFAFLLFSLVRPMQRITNSMIEFRENPEDARRVIVPSNRTDEIGGAERELADMQVNLRAALKQKAHLAALGEAVAKINHDLRNILSSATLVSDRLSSVKDPTVQRLSPKLIGAIDRAVSLCTNTLKYGRATESQIDLQNVKLHPVVLDAAAATGLTEDGSVRLVNDIPDDLIVIADPDHLFRILLNLIRNAYQALTMSGSADGGGEIRLRARTDNNGTIIDITDTGPGIPKNLREGLFKPFAISTSREGSGLGLSIAMELARAQGGKVELVRTGSEGTCFRVVLPSQIKSPS